jgi:hypothetical protein
MSVQISELQVVPGQRQPGEPQQQPPPQQGSQEHTLSPAQAHEIARTVGLLQARDLRLHAD